MTEEILIRAYVCGGLAVFVVCVLFAAVRPYDPRREDTPFSDAVVAAMLWPLMAAGLCMALIAVVVTAIIGRPALELPRRDDDEDAT